MTPKLQQVVIDTRLPGVGRTRQDDRQLDEPTAAMLSLTDNTESAGSSSSAPVAGAASTRPVGSSNRVSGTVRASLLAAGSPGDDPVGSPEEVVLLAGVRREFGGGRLRHVASSQLTAQAGPGDADPATVTGAAKTLSALAIPQASANPLQSFTSLINTAITTISKAFTSAFNAVSGAITTAVKAIGDVITSVLKSFGVITTPANQVPKVVNDGGLTTAEDTPVSVDTTTLLSNDSDADGDELSVTGVSAGAHGTAVLNGTTVTYTPNANFNGADSFTYTVSDGHGGTATATVAVTVTPVNDAPVAGGNSVSTAEDAAVSITAGSLLANDSDADGDTLSVTGVSAGAHGTAVLNGTTVTYTPNANFNGADSFTYTVSDGHGGTATATVAVTVTPVNDAPVAGGNTVSTAEDAAVSITAGSLLGNDSDADGDTLSVTGVSAGAHGTAVLNGTTVTYTPNANFNGADSFTYTVSDGHGGTATATVAVTVTPVNDAPVAGGNTVTTAEGTPVSITASTLLGNDSDADGDTLSVTGVSAGAHGTAVLNGTTVTYTPNANFNGADSFTYMVSDGHGGTTTGTVSVTVTPVNNAPIAVGDSVTTAEDTTVSITAGTLLGNDSDADGEALSISGIGQPEHGTTELIGGAVVYDPDIDFNGADSFTYTVSDGHGGTATATVSVTVTPVNDEPSPLDDVVTTAENTAVTIDVLANDIDWDGDPLTVVAAGMSTHGTVVANEDGSITYTPDENYTGSDTFSYTISDGTAEVSASVTVKVGTPVVNPLHLSDIDDAEFHVTAAGDVYVVGQAFIEVPGTGQGYDKNIVGLLNEDGTVSIVRDLSDIVPANFSDDVAIGPDGRIYVLDNGWYGADGTLTVYDGDTSHVILHDGDLSEYGVDFEQDSLAGDWIHLAIGSDGKIYLATPLAGEGNSAPSALTVLNANGTVAVAPVDLGFGYGYVRDLVVGADGRAYVLGRDPASANDVVLVVDQSGSVERISLGNLAVGSLAVGADGTIFVSNSGAIIAVNDSGPFGTLKGVPAGSAALAGSPQGLYVFNDGAVTVVDPTDIEFQTSAVHSLDDFLLITGVAVSAHGTQYVVGAVNAFGTTVTRLARVDAGGAVTDLGPVALTGPGAIAVGQDELVYVAGLNGITVINTATEASSLVPGTAGPTTHVAIGTDGNIYFTGSHYSEDAGGVADYVSIVDPNGNVVLAPVDIADQNGRMVTGLAVGPDGRIYVTSYGSGASTSALTILNADGTTDTDIPLSGASPTGVAVGADGTAYILSLGRVLAVDSAGAVSTVRTDWTLATSPMSIAIGPDGTLYVAVTNFAQGTGAVSVLDPTLRVGDSNAGHLSDFIGLYGIAVGSDGRKYVLGYNYDSSGSTASKLVVVGADGTSVTQLVDMGPGSGTVDVEIGPDGRLYVSDAINGTVTAYDPANNYAPQLIRAIPGPSGLAIGNGRIYVGNVLGSTDPEDPESIMYAGALTILNTDGSLVKTIDLDASAVGVDLGPGGRVYVTTFTSSDGGATANGALMIFSSAGVLEKTVGLADRLPYDVAVGADGTAYIADVRGHILTVDQNGTVGELAAATYPFGLDLGTDGKLYVTSLLDFTGQGASITVIDTATNL